jgi:cytochrome c peroxidase
MRATAPTNALFDPDLDPALDPAHQDAARFPPSATPLDAEGPWATMAPGDRDIVNRAYANFGKALAAYERRLLSGEAPFDRYVAGDTSCDAA